ncbi:MAG TPA: DUF3800 domain-containing protein [Edaphobacter sp.]|nr:DUF3800 domain-containing protein [Edaphobacter sp.]
MLKVYMDDSGSHDTSHNRVIAGYWGEVREWRRFERKWSGVIVGYGVKEFKANEFWPRISGGRRNPPYNGWTDAKADSYIDDLLKVIESRRVFPFAFGVLGEEWNKMLPHHRGALTLGAVEDDLQKSLFVPLTLAILRTLDYCHSGKSIDFSFDDDPNNIRLKQAIVACFSQIRANLLADGDPAYEKVGEFGFNDSIKATPIQAADLLAYEAHLYSKEARGNPAFLMRDSYIRATSRSRSPLDFQLADDAKFASIKRTFAEIDSQLRAELGTITTP